MWPSLVQVFCVGDFLILYLPRPFSLRAVPFSQIWYKRIVLPWNYFPVEDISSSRSREFLCSQWKNTVFNFVQLCTLFNNHECVQATNNPGAVVITVVKPICFRDLVGNLKVLCVLSRCCGLLMRCRQAWQGPAGGWLWTTKKSVQMWWFWEKLFLEEFTL